MITKDNEISSLILWDALTEGVEKGKYSLNLNGHFAEEAGKESAMTILRNLMFIDFQEENKEKIRAIFLDNKKLEKPFPLCKISKFEACPNCRKESIVYFDGKTIFIADKCKKIQPSPFNVNIPVPSGNLVMFDDLREFVNIKDKYDLNGYEGLKATTEDYAKKYMFHSFVGNSCPSFGLINNNEKELYFGTGNKIQSKGCICTNLWWVSVIDEQILKIRMEKMGYENKEIENIINGLEKITVPKGWYEATANFPAFGYNNDIYAYMRHSKDIKESFLENFKSELDNEFEETEVIFKGIEETKIYKNNVNNTASLTFLNSLIGHYLSNHYVESDEENWIDYDTYNEKLTYEQKAHKNIKIQKALDNKEFLSHIPLFNTKDFMKMGLNMRRMSTYAKLEDFTWKGFIYPKNVERYELAFMLMTFYNVLLNKNHEGLEETYKKLKKDKLLDKLTFGLNLAYTNMVERGIENNIITIFEEIKTKHQYLLNEHSKGLVPYLQKEMEMEMVHYQYFNQCNNEELLKVFEEKIKKKIEE